MSIRENWNALSDRWRTFFIWFVPLWCSFGLFAADWVWRMNDGPPNSNESRRLAIRAGVAFLFWVAIKLAFTRGWTFDAIGSIWALAGVAGAFVRIFGQLGPAPGDHEYVAIWSAIDVGTTILLLGLPIWLIVHLFHQHGVDPPWDGSERRVEQRRRWPDRRQDE